MSYWYEPTKEDIELDGDHLNIWLGQDDNGAIYAQIKTKDIEESINRKTTHTYCSDALICNHKNHLGD